MPVFKANGKLCYFAHIPKCGGTSVERYLQARFGAVGFLDVHHLRRDEQARWSKTSPQHIDWDSLQKLLPENMLDDVFAVVRHPVSRAISSYGFQLHVEKSADATMSFSEWFRSQLSLYEKDPFTIDNHFRPQVEFFPSSAAVFHLEHGLDAIIPHLDTLAGNRAGPRQVGHANEKKPSAAKAASPVLSPEDLELLTGFYARDFEAFGYSVDKKAPSAPSKSHLHETTAEQGLVDKLKKRLRMG